MKKLTNLYTNLEAHEDFFEVTKSLHINKRLAMWTQEIDDVNFKRLEPFINETIFHLWGNAWNFQDAIRNVIIYLKDCEYLREQITAKKNGEGDNLPYKDYFAELSKKSNDLRILIEAVKAVKALADYTLAKREWSPDDYSVCLSYFEGTHVNGSWIEN